MNVGLLQKSIREIWFVTAICCLAIAIFEGIVTYLFWTYQEELAGDFLQLEFMKNLINALVGSRTGGEIGPETLQSVAWVHPLVLAIFFAHVITSTTRIPVGEIDAGTVDTLLAMPVSRWTVYAHDTLVWASGGLCILFSAVFGFLIGNHFIPPEGQIPLSKIFIVITNLYMLYLCIGAFSAFLSTRSNSRGRAVGGAVGTLLVLLIWNFVEQYWEPAQRVSFLNVLTYYKPMPILADGQMPWKNVVVLLAVAGTLWYAGGRHFHRRDIHTL